MKSLAIDCRSINKQKTGVGNVLYNILKRLKLNNCNITLFFDRTLEEDEIEFFKKLGYNIEIINCSSYLIWEQFLLPIKVGKRFDYVWFPSNTGSIFIKSKKIATIHDVIFSKSIKEIPLSGILKKDLARIYRCVFARVLAKKAVRIYTVSNFSKTDIKNLYNIDDNKIKVIHNGLDSSFIENKIYCDKQDYILSFGSNEPRKNTELMIYSYNRLINQYKELEHIKLVLYGFRGYKNSKIQKLIKDLKIEDKVIVYEYVTDEILKKLYKNAKVFCFLSKYEGFGLPIIESMASSTPVIAINNSSISEIVGQSGILLDDSSVNNISENIYNLLTNNELYNEIIDLGIKNIERFNWDISIKELSDDLNNIMSD